MENVSTDSFLKIFPVCRNEQTLQLEKLLTNGVKRNLSKGDSLYFEGDQCQGIGFLLSGEIRVFKIGEIGREITLYEIFPGETCILNASCLLSSQRYPANAAATADGTILFIPADFFMGMMSASAIMRDFIFSLFSRRFNEIIELLEEVTFGKLNERLSEYLIEKSCNDLLLTSHQKIANDLGTSREVISRLLKDFERKGQVALSRNQVRIIRL